MNKVATEFQQEQQPEKKHQKVLRESFFLLYIVLTLAYTALISYFLGSAIMIFSDLKNGTANSLARDMIDVWKNNYIITDIALTSTTKCPSGYSLAYNFQWPGLNNLCSCPSTQNYDITYSAFLGQCSQNDLLQSSCINSNAIPTQNLNLWRNYKRLCVKYGSDTFYSMPINCGNQSGYQVCGTGDTRICVKNSEACPISSLIVSTSGLGTSNFKSISIDSTNYVYYRYDQNSFPVAYFKITNDYFCGFHAKNFAPNQALFLYSTSNADFDCQAVDRDFRIVDSMGLSDFLTINNLTDSLTAIPSYPQATNEYSTYLGSRSYQYWSYSCRDNSDYDLKSVDDFFSLNRDSSYQIGLIIVTVVSLLISGVILPGIDIAKRYFMGEEKRAEAKVLKTSTLILDKFFRFTLFPLIIVCYTQVKNEINWLKSISDFKCSTDYFYQSVQTPHFNSLNDLASFYGDILALWVLMVILDIVYLTIRFMTDRKKEIIIKATKAPAEEIQPLNNKIVPVEEKEISQKNDKTDLEEGVDHAEINSIAQELKKIIQQANEPSKAMVKGLEMEMKGTMNDIKENEVGLSSHKNISSRDFLINKKEDEEEKQEKQESQKNLDEILPKNNKVLPPLKIKTKKNLEDIKEIDTPTKN